MEKDPCINDYTLIKEKSEYYDKLARVHLTPRERDSLDLLLKNKTNRQIGEALGISHRTVEFYINRIKIKFQVSKKSDLIVLFCDVL